MSENSMGQSILLKCSNCDNRISLQTGQGIRDNDPERILSYFDSTSQEKIRQYLSDDIDRVMWSFTRMPAVCRLNRDVKAVPVFSVTTEKGTDRVVICGCDCGGEHDLYSEDELERGSAHVICPRCGREMEYSVTGYWD